MKTLVGVDFSDPSIAACGWVSRWLVPEGPLAVAYSVEFPSTPGFNRVRDHGHDEILAHAKDEAQKALAPLVQDFGPDRTVALVGAGSPALGVLELADRWGADLIAIGPHGHSPFLTGFFGSTAARLLRRSTIPVLVVREPENRPPQRILVALDERDATERVLQLTKAVFDLHQCEVRGLYVFETLLEGLPIFGGPSGDIDLEAGLEDTASRWLQEVLLDAGIPESKISTAVGRGRPGTAICTTAAEDFDLVVMGTHGDPLAGPALGSVARSVVAHAPCPVLVVPTKA